MTAPLLPPSAAPDGTPRAPAGKTPEAQRAAAQAFEAQALGALLQPMFEGLGAGNAFGGGAGEAQWQSMLVTEYGKVIARAGGIGLADAVLREMLKMQEG
ncbi:rod-binding protein [Roseicella aquatilis]|uniref:Chemotaxis protein chel n=1 Tax=Roseicella aquatilis TaxID=2527868 RepID=A0A4R4D356_9PROT|nr:rod-binding protein [Roseicella aquatilis]TCZ53662.1 chemotaxis protein chel [Roseicella aquatilis]